MVLSTKSNNCDSGRIVLPIFVFSSSFFWKKIFLFAIYCFAITICVTNCTANDDLAIDWLTRVNADSDEKLSHLERRDVNQESLPLMCSTDEDCHQYTMDMMCSNEKCICNRGFTTTDNNTCIQTDSNVVNDDHNQSQDQNGSEEHTSNETPVTKKDGLHMLPIMIVLGIMFVGMCVALNLFSRARFRQNRSIFSNPRLLKLGHSSSKTKTKRRTSPPNPNSTIVAETELPKNGSYVSIALES